MNFQFVFLPPQGDSTRIWAKRLAQAVPEADVVVAQNCEEARREIVNAEAAFGTLTPDLLSMATRLRWLQAPAAAPAAGYYFPELVQHPVQVTNFRGIYNDHISAHIMAFVLAFARGLHRYIGSQWRREWQPQQEESSVVHLPEATALIVGVGGIGGETARLCAAFGMHVIGIDARRHELAEGISEMHPPQALDQLLPRADFVIMTIPHTPHTGGLIQAERLRRMKPSAFLINIGRGLTVKLDDLDAALRDGTIAGAGLDVYEIEPLPADHPLWTAPNVLLTPHVAGVGAYLDERRLEIIIDNARRFASGQELRNLVDKADWF